MECGWKSKNCTFHFYYSNMQENTCHPLDLNRRQTYSGQDDAPSPFNGGTWNQLQEQAKD